MLSPGLLHLHQASLDHPKCRVHSEDQTAAAKQTTKLSKYFCSVTLGGLLFILSESGSNQRWYKIMATLAKRVKELIQTIQKSSLIISPDEMMLRWRVEMMIVMSLSVISTCHRPDILTTPSLPLTQTEESHYLIIEERTGEQICQVLLIVSSGQSKMRKFVKYLFFVGKF